MVPSPPDDVASHSLDLDALLREGAWVRRLAGGLLNDETAADDLSQEVFAAALRQRPALAGARLRGWLGTVARRLASRSRERERSRCHAEREAARPEVVERDALQRLDLHRRLTAAIDSLDPPYRTALVLESPPSTGPRVRVVDEAGRVPQNAKAAWIDSSSRVCALELDEYGTVLRPGSSDRARFFAHAPGYAEEYTFGGEVGEDVVLVLRPACALRGTVVEDGGPPTHPLRLWEVVSTDGNGLTIEEWRLRAPLVELGALRESGVCWTNADGNFVHTGLREGGKGHLLLP